MTSIHTYIHEENSKINCTFANISLSLSHRAGTFILWSHDRTLSLIMSIFFLYLQCKHGCFTINVHQRRTKCSDLITVKWKYARCWKSSTINSVSKRSVQDGCQESLLKSTSANVLRSANIYSITTRNFEQNSHRRWNMYKAESRGHNTR